MTTKCDNIQSIFKEFVLENKLLVFSNCFLEIVLPPLEISIFRNIAEKFIENIDKWKKQNFMKNIIRFKIYLYLLFLILIQAAYFVNKFILNKLIPKFRILVRNKIMKDFVANAEQNENIDLTISLNAMPKALYNFYISIFKFIIPLFVLFGYICFSIFKIDRKISSLMFFYSFFNILFTIYMTIQFSKESSTIWNKHGDLVKEYDNLYSEKKIVRGQVNTMSEKEKEQLVDAEQNFEKERFCFYRNINFFIFYSMMMFFITGCMIIFLCRNKHGSTLQKLLTLFVFSARFYNTLLSRITIAVDAFGRLRILNQQITQNCL